MPWVVLLIVEWTLKVEEVVDSDRGGEELTAGNVGCPGLRGWWLPSTVASLPNHVSIREDDPVATLVEQS